MAEILLNISIISFILAGMSGVLTIVLCIKFKIWIVIGDLSGKNMRKSLEEMRTNNEKSRSVLEQIRASRNEGRTAKGMRENKQLTGNETKELRPLAGSETKDLSNQEWVMGSLKENEVDIKHNNKVDLELLEEIILVNTNEIIE